MDYVDGVPLGRQLSTAQPDVPTTPDPFVTVCEPAEYAHGCREDGCDVGSAISIRCSSSAIAASHLAI